MNTNVLSLSCVNKIVHLYTVTIEVLHQSKVQNEYIFTEWKMQQTAAACCHSHINNSSYSRFPAYGREGGRVLLSDIPILTECE